jgi:RNA polymerase sigma factor (sigma-70 family)
MTGKSNDLLINKISLDKIKMLRTDGRLFERFVKTNEKFFHNVALKFNPNFIYEHEDYFQIALISVYNVIDKYDATRGSFSTFIYKCIYNDILQTINKANNIISHETSIENFTRISEDSNTSEYNESIFKSFANEDFENTMITQIEINNFVNKLEDIHKEIFERRVIKKMKHKEVAEDMGLNYHTYKHIWHYSVNPKLKQLEELFTQ